MRIPPTAHSRAADLVVNALWTFYARRGWTGARFLTASIAPGDVVIDVGAACGAYSRRMLELAGPTGRVHAIEPNPAARPALERIALLHPNFTFDLGAASDRTGTATLHIPRGRDRPRHGLASLGPPDDGTAVDAVEVPLLRLDDALADVPEEIVLIKIDVEGHELPVLEGAPATLASCPCLLVEVEQRHHREPIHTVFDHLSRLGYAGWALFPDGLGPVVDFDVQRDQLRFVTGAFQNRMPRGYVNDFCFLEAGRLPAPELLRGRVTVPAAA